MSDEKLLTEKQRLFCEYYIENWNASDAARRAGYSEKTAHDIGCENLKKPNIKKYIEEIQNDLSKIAGISRLSLIKDLINLKDYAEQDKDKIKAIEVINKMTGFNEPDKFDHTSKGEKITNDIDYSKLDTDTLLKIQQASKK